MLYAILNQFTPIKFSDYFQMNNLPTRSHSLTIHLLPSSINAFRYVFFINCVFTWNSIPFDVLSASTKNVKQRLKCFLFSNCM